MDNREEIEVLDDGITIYEIAFAKDRKNAFVYEFVNQENKVIFKVTYTVDMEDILSGTMLPLGTDSDTINLMRKTVESEYRLHKKRRR